MMIKFKQLTLENFKNHKKLEVNFTDITHIEGRNGSGKSSVGDAITWLLYGIDTIGNKLDPKPIGTEEETKVELLLQIDEKQILLGRSQKKTAKYYINEVPEKATKFGEIVDELFDKNLFLSLFNPTYFSLQHWQEQRKQLLQFVSEPLNKEVLAVISELQANTLELLLKKHSVDDLEKIHRERFNKRDKDLIRARERTTTLKEQLEKHTNTEIDLNALQTELTSLQEKRFKLDEESVPQRKEQEKRMVLEKEVEMLKQNVLHQRGIAQQIKDEPLEENCCTCGQPLTGEAVEKVKLNKTARLQKEVGIGKQMVKTYNELLEKLEQMPVIEIQTVDTSQLNERIFELKNKLQQHQQVEQLKQEIEQAELNYETIRKERNESQSIVEAIKEFRSKQAELMVKKVDSLFTNVSVRLFEELKNGEFRDTFEIEMDGKPYSKLSTAEKIKCGLEVVDVLSHQSSLIVPTFVDNAESILHFSKPLGQLLVARVVDKELEIKNITLKEETNHE